MLAAATELLDRLRETQPFVSESHEDPAALCVAHPPYGLRSRRDQIEALLRAKTLNLSDDGLRPNRTVTQLCVELRTHSHRVPKTHAMISGCAGHP